MKKIYILIVFQVMIVSMLAQNFGGHPSDVEWKSIDNEHVQLIYPKGLKARAERVADIIKHINRNNVYSVGNTSKKIDIVLHTNQVISNGFVGLAPYRSEFFGIGMQNMNHLGSIDWLDILSVHEYRHALQFTNSRFGFSKFMSYLFGQVGWALSINLSIPSWYFEGDAVLTETLLSESGRGRMPSFYKELRANLLSDKKYTYMVYRNGSYNRMLPSIYPFGFAICNYTRNNYGDDVWAKILKDAGRYKTIIYPFSGAMKKHTGVRTHKMYKKAFAQLKIDWKTELQNINLTPLQVVSPSPKRTVTNYRFAQVMKDGTLVALKNSYKETARIVQIKNGQESKLVTHGISQNIYLSSNNDRLAWTEFEVDIRRDNRNYNKILVYDFNKKTKKTICKKTKYFSPHISSDGSKIVVVNITEQLQNSLVIIDSYNGNEIVRLSNLDNDFLSFPKWTHDNKHIVYIAKRKSKLALIKMNIETQQTVLLTNWSSHVIGSTSVGEKYVYFSASFSGIDNIYAVSLTGDKQIKQLTSVKVGAYQPVINKKGNKLIMSRFTAMGYELAKLDISKDISTYPEINYTEPTEQTRYKIKTNKYENNIFNDIEKGNYQEQAYKGLFKGMKFHSWFFTLDQDFLNFSILMNNTLNNLSGMFGLEYNYNEQSYVYNVNLIYAKWFPMFYIGGRFGERKTHQLVIGGKIEKLHESKLKFGINIPLKWIRNKYKIKLNTVAEINHSELWNTNNFELKNSGFSSVSSELRFSVLHAMAYQNIMPHLGFKINAELKQSIIRLRAKKIYTDATVFLPSVFKNHGFKFNAAFNWENSGNDYIFQDRFRYSRGYSAIINDQIYRLSVNYSFPILYPNWGFFGYTHFKRIRANMFLDMSKSKFKGVDYDMNSYGAELIFDNKMLNILPISLGLRNSFLLNKDYQFPDRKNWFEVFISMNI